MENKLDAVRGDITSIVALLESPRVDRNVRLIHIKARRFYAITEAIIRDNLKFMRVIVAYYLFHKLYVQGVQIAEDIKSAVKRYELEASPLQKSKDRGEVIKIIEETFKSNGGYRYARMISATGLDGGIYKVLDGISIYLEKQDVDNYIRSVLTTYVPQDDFQRRMELAQQFMKKYSDSDYWKGLNITVQEIAVYPHLENMILEFIEKLSNIRDRVYRL